MLYHRGVVITNRSCLYPCERSIVMITHPALSSVAACNGGADDGNGRGGGGGVEGGDAVGSIGVGGGKKALTLTTTTAAIHDKHKRQRLVMEVVVVPLFQGLLLGLNLGGMAVKRKGEGELSP